MGKYRPSFYRYLDTVGDGSGTKNAIGNYSGGEQRFKLIPPANDNFAWYCRRMIVLIEDVGQFEASGYGSDSAALTNGISLFHRRDGVDIEDFMDGVPVVANAQWGQLCFDIAYNEFGTGLASNFLSVRYTFGRSGAPIGLFPKKTDSLELVLNDDFSILQAHTFFIQGFKDGPT